MASPRSSEQRKADALAKLGASNADLWVASAGAAGEPHLVPLSYAWDGEHVILATEPRAVTTRNIVRARRARVALGDTRDVVMIDAVLARNVPGDDADPAVAEAYAGQADWDPRTSAAEFVFLLLRPERIQVWREENEIAGRTVMRAGTWTV